MPKTGHGLQLRPPRQEGKWAQLRCQTPPSQFGGFAATFGEESMFVVTYKPQVFDTTGV